MVTGIDFKELMAGLKPPSEEECREMYSAEFKAVEPVLLSNLDVGLLSIETRFIEIESKVLRELIIPAYDGVGVGEAEQYLINMMTRNIYRILGDEKAVEDFGIRGYDEGGSYVMWKLDSRSAKDAGMCRVKVWKDMPFGALLEELKRNFIDDFFCSMRIFEDLCMHSVMRDRVYLCLRKWVDIAEEYRVFVKAGEVIGMCRNSTVGKEIQDQIELDFAGSACRLIAARCVSAMEEAGVFRVNDFVIDVIEGVDGYWHMLELNPYGYSHPCLFGSYENLEGGNLHREHELVMDNRYA